MSTKKGPPKHQNTTTWKPNRAVKKKETDLGGKMNPYPMIAGVCKRCKDQIEWKRKYGKYKTLRGPGKCIQCSKRNISVAYMSLCPSCAKEKKACAKCCKTESSIIQSPVDSAEDLRRLEEALKSVRERDRRTLLRAMAKGGDAKAMADKAEKLKEQREQEGDDFELTDDDEDEEDDDSEDDDGNEDDSGEEEDSSTRKDLEKSGGSG